MVKKINFSKLIAPLFYTIVFMLYLLPAILLPFNSSPDEAMRFEVVKGIIRSDCIPRLFDYNSYIDSTWGFSYAFFISNLQYILVYMVYWFIKFFYHGEIFIIGRLVAVFIGIACVYTFEKIVVAIFTETKEKNVERVLLTSIYAFWPQVAFMFTYVNADSGALLITNMLVLCFTNGWRNQWSKYEIYALGILIGCAIISYYNEYAVIMGVILGFFVDVISRRLLTLKLVKKISISVLLLLIVCFPYILNNILYYHDLFGLGLAKITSNVFAPFNNQPVHSHTLFNTGKTIWYLLTDWQFWFKTIASFIGWFGYMNIPYPKIIYALVVIVFIILSIFGFKYLTRKSFFDSNLFFILCLIGIVSFVISIMLFISFSYFAAYQAQGRYLFPSFLFIILLPLYGLYRAKSGILTGIISFALLSLCIYSINLQLSFYHVELSFWNTIKFILFGLCVLVILSFEYFRKIFISILIVCSLLVIVKFIYFSYFQNFYYMKNNQFSQPVIQLEMGKPVIQIKSVNGVRNNEIDLKFERNVSNIFPILLLINGRNKSNLYLSYNGRAYPSLSSLSLYDAKTGTTQVGFIIGDFIYTTGSEFKIGSYSDGIFKIESSIKFKIY